MLDDPRLPICLALLVLTCGQIVLWRRRDNLFGYVQVGIFVSTMLIPLFGTSIVGDADPRVVDEYVQVLLAGAAAYVGGLCLGASLGRLPNRVSLTFTRPLAATEVPVRLWRRARQIAVASALALAASFVLLGYVPFLAGDRRSAKFGVGPYQAGFQRGALVYHVALAAAAAILPIMLVVLYRRRRPVDLAICVFLALGLALTLSRAEAFTGPLLVLLAVAVQRRVRPWLMLVATCLAFLAGALVNEVLYTAPPTASPSLAARLSASAPDLSDHLGFVQGLSVRGDERIGLRTLGSALQLRRGEWDPADYALRTVTGLNDVSQLTSGGVRLPPPLWGYAAYGLAGALVWSFLSGVVTGWGTVKLRELLSPVQDSPGLALNLILAVTFYAGTFGLLATFYFPERSGLVVAAIALALCVERRVGAAAPEGPPVGLPAS